MQAPQDTQVKAQVPQVHEGSSLESEGCEGWTDRQKWTELTPNIPRNTAIFRNIPKYSGGALWCPIQPLWAPLHLLGCGPRLRALSSWVRALSEAVEILPFLVCLQFFLLESNGLLVVNIHVLSSIGLYLLPLSIPLYYTQ